MSEQLENEQQTKEKARLRQALAEERLVNAYLQFSLAIHKGRPQDMVDQAEALMLSKEFCDNDDGNTSGRIPDDLWEDGLLSGFCETLKIMLR